MKFALKYALHHEHQPVNSPAEMQMEVEADSADQAVSKTGLDLHEAYPGYEIVLTDCRPHSETTYQNEFAGKVSKK